MRNITITMPDELAARVRVEAAREGKSVSKFVGELVEKRVGRRRTQAEALAAFLSGPLWDMTDEAGRLPGKEALYDDALLPRHERADLQPGPPQHREATDGPTVADRARKP